MKKVDRGYTRLMVLISALLPACFGPEAGGLAPAPSASTTVKVDLLHQPLPEIPLPNDLATRHDPSSATGRRLNVSMLAPTRMEAHLRRQLNELDGWGIFQPIAIPFSGPLDLDTIVKAHRAPDDPRDDVVYLINVDQGSPGFGRMHRLDVGEGNFPVTAESLDAYGDNDPRGWTLSLLFEEEDEDKDGDGVLDPAEDTDADGVLDRPNYLPGRRPARADLAGRADALMTFYERQTHTLLLRPLAPLDERTTYAVVVTRRLKDAAGEPVGSPYPSINHTSQTRALRPLLHLLPGLGLKLEQIAFAFTFTTQSVQASIKAVRDGLYGHGMQAHLGSRFPARLSSLERVREVKHFPGLKNAFIIQPEHFLQVFEIVAKLALNNTFGNTTDSTIAQVREDQRYVDFHVIGSFSSPQLFRRTDSAGRAIERHYQTWPPDLDRVAVNAEADTVYFWLTVPRKEVSARGQGKPVPVVIQSHGYNSTRAEGAIWGSYLSRYGVANIGIDFPAHGLGLSPFEEKAARVIAEPQGLLPLLEAVIRGRAVDQNADGTKDPGADFLTAYTFHTRDMMRQTVLDYMQLIRVVRTFDGKRRWAFDVNGDGVKELAGDFDGDGVPDVDGRQIVGVTGMSLGGIVSLLTGSLEPAVPAVAAVSGAGGLSDVGVRSHQGGVPEAVLLRMMGPLFVGDLSESGETLLLKTTVPDGIKQRSYELARVAGVAPGDTMLVQNLRNGERGCGLVSPAGKVRAGVASDGGDRLKITFHAGAVVTGEHCQLRPGSKIRATVDRFPAQATNYQGKVFAAGTPLQAIAEGLGQRRASPGLRRLLNLSQAALDPGDPIAYVQHLRRRPLRYATGETTGASILMTGSVGDMSVPVAATIAAARVAGIVDDTHVDPRYGKTVNRVLVDTHTVEGVHPLGRYRDAKGGGIHMDVDDLSRGSDLYGTSVPRLSPPLRIGANRRDARGGFSALLFPYSDPAGMHVFALPGMMTDQARALCKQQCTRTGSADPCACDAQKPFDIGIFMGNVLSRYLASGGKKLDLSACNSSDTCPDRQPPPSLRDPKTLH